MRAGVRAAATMAIATTIAACGSGITSQTASPAAATPTTLSEASSASTQSASTQTASPQAATPSVPELIDVEHAGALNIRATASIDWIALVDGSAYVAGLGDGIGRLDASGERTGLAELAGWCEAMDVGFDAVWSATCEPSGLARIDPDTLDVTTIRFDLPTEDSEGSVGAGEGAIWAVVGGLSERQLMKVDPDTLEVIDTFEMPAGAGPVRAGLGAVWVTNPLLGVLHRVDPGTGEVTETITVGPAPRFLAVGEGGVWVMNQEDGTVSHVDPETNGVVATIDVGSPIRGGDIAVGGGSVWVRGGPELLARVDPATDTTIEKYRPPVGSGSVAADDEAVWVTAHDARTIWRLPLD